MNSPPESIIKQMSPKAAVGFAAESAIDRLEKLLRRPDQFEEFSAESPLRNPKRFLTDALRDLVTSAYTAYRLYCAQLAQRYRYSSLGFVWAFAPPAMTALAVTLGQRAHIAGLNPTDVSGQFYALFGLILLQSFLEPINTQRSLFTANRHLLNRRGPILEASLLAGLADNLFSLGLKLPILVGMFAFYSIYPAHTLVLGMVLLLSTLILGTCAGLLLAPLNAVKRDVNHMMLLLPWVAIAVTPVLMEPTASSRLWGYYQFNPLTWIFGAARALSYGHATASDGVVLAATVVAAIVLMPTSWLLCRIARPYVVERTLL